MSIESPRRTFLVFESMFAIEVWHGTVTLGNIHIGCPQAMEPRLLYSVFESFEDNAA